MSSRKTVPLDWMEIRTRFPNLEAYINTFSQFFFVRKTIQDGFPDLVESLLPQMGARGSYTTQIDGSTYTLRFGVHKGMVGIDPDTNTLIKTAKAAYYPILLEAIAADAAFWKPDLNLNVMFPGHTLQKMVLNETQFAELCRRGGEPKHLTVTDVPKSVHSFIFCRQQERNLEGIVERTRLDAAVDMHRLSLEQNYETQMPKGIAALVIPLMGKTPCLIKNHDDHHAWQQRILTSQANAIQLEKDMIAAGKMASKYTPYFSLTVS